MTATTHLQNLIRLNTSNPPGNEILAAQYLSGVLGQAGYEPEIVESAPGRGSVVARFRGDGSQRPLLLYNHLDVVPVERDQWSRDPFGGDLHEGYVWGRGALDMKNVVTQQLLVMLRLAAERPRLRRDVIFAGCADEEAGGEFGLKYLVRTHRDLVDAEMGLSETGAFPLHVNDKAVYPIQCGEKGNCRLVLRASAAPGHGASPNYNNYAIRFLAIAIERLTSGRLPTHITPTLQNALRQLAPVLDQNAEALTDPTRLDELLPTLPYPFMRDLIRNVTSNTAAPTLLRAGVKINVVPSVAEVELDGRLLPGQTNDDLMAEVAAAIGSDLPVEIIHLPEFDSPALERPSSGPMWEALVRNLRKHDPNAIIIPILLAGGTDAKHLEPLNVQTYGFSPMHYPPEFDWRGLVHGHNERLPVVALDWGIRVLYDTVMDLCA